jgi:predicted PhzF superfamily epimerase YddE/YHI9
VPLFGVDAFTAAAFAGNPAAVCLLDGDAWPDDTWCGAVAAELNLSETAFVLPGGDGFGLRWFTPTVEVELCGHATLASAHVLWAAGRLAGDAPARFHTRGGVLVATRSGDHVVLDFPALASVRCPAPPGLEAALGVPARAVARNPYHLLVEVDGAATVRALTPDLAGLAGVDATGVCVTAPGDRAGIDFVSRFFAPRAGIPEDPVTGSAHCALGPWWAPRLGRGSLIGEQVSRRGGIVHVRVDGSRVQLAGQAVTVWRGELLRP